MVTILTGEPRNAHVEAETDMELWVLNMPVAIKMMRHDMAMDPDFLTQFQNEAKTIAGSSDN